MDLTRTCRWCLAVAFPLVLGCGGSGGGDEAAGLPGEKDPFGGDTKTTVRTYETTLSGGTQQPYLASWAPATETAAGREWPVYQVKQTATCVHCGLRVRMELKDDRFTFQGGSAFWGNGPGAVKDQPYFSGEMDTPMTIDLNPPVGVTQTVHVTGKLAIADPANLQAAEATATYRLVSADETHTGPIGTVHGCRHFTGEADVNGVKVSAEMWYHPDLGVVDARADYPTPGGTGVNLASILDLGSVPEGWNAIRKMDVIGPGHPAFELNTYDINRDFDADKNEHAKMLLEMRWADDDLAKTRTDVPYLQPEFGTVWGVFGCNAAPKVPPCALAMSPVSLFHPEENGKGFHYYVAFVSQAAKNEAQNGIAYHVKVPVADFLSNDLRVTARILYKVYKP